MLVDDFDLGYGQYVRLDDIDNIEADGHLLVEDQTYTLSIERKPTDNDKYTEFNHKKMVDNNQYDNDQYDIIEIREENDKFNVKHLIIELVTLVYQLFKFNIY